MRQANQSKNVKNKVIYRRLQNAATISVLVGLTWVFGLLAIGKAKVYFQLLFTVFNSLQGLAIFLLFCLRADDVRETLKPHLLWFRKLSAWLTWETAYEISQQEAKCGAVIGEAQELEYLKVANKSSANAANRSPANSRSIWSESEEVLLTEEEQKYLAEELNLSN